MSALNQTPGRSIEDEFSSMLEEFNTLKSQRSFAPSKEPQFDQKQQFGQQQPSAYTQQHPSQQYGQQQSSQQYSQQQPSVEKDPLKDMEACLEYFHIKMGEMQKQISNLEQAYLERKGNKLQPVDRFGFPEEEEQQLPVTQQKGKQQTAGKAIIAPKRQQKTNRPLPMPEDIRKQLQARNPNTLKEIFSVEPVEEIAFHNWQHKRLVLIGEDRTMERTLSRISSHNIHCLPVVSESKSGIVGSIDVLDIINGLICAWNRNSSQTIQQNVRREFMNMTVKELMNEAKRSTFVCSNQCSLLNVVQYMVKNDQDRLIVVDRKVEGEITKLTNPEFDVDGIITSFDILKFLVANSNLMRKDPFFNRTIRDVIVDKRAPRVVNFKTNVSDAFREIAKLGIDGFAVVDDQGKLIGNLSACDLKGVTRNNCPILNTTVEEFLNRDQKKYWFEKPFTIDPNDSLFHAVHQFVSLGKQRLYVINSQGKPIGEVSRKDLLHSVWNSFNMHSIDSSSHQMSQSPQLSQTTKVQPQKESFSQTSSPQSPEQSHSPSYMAPSAQSKIDSQETIPKAQSHSLSQSSHSHDSHQTLCNDPNCHY